MASSCLAATAWRWAESRGLFVLARIAHPIGMDGPQVWRWRMVGMMTTVLAIAVLAIWAIICAGGALLGG